MIKVEENRIKAGSFRRLGKSRSAEEAYGRIASCSVGPGQDKVV